MNIFRKAFIAIVLLTASLSALAFDLPVHHQYVLFNSEARNTDYYNYDMHVVWHKEPDASQMGIPTWAVWRLGFTNPTAVAS